MRISAALPLGVTALLFEAAQKRRRLEARLVEELESRDFSEVMLPILDYLDPYEPMLNPASRGELYRFIDRGGELLALRSDFTPMLARLLAPRLPSLPLPLRLFYRGDVVRYEEERAGRQREFYQLGAELMGVAGEEGEREMLRLFLHLLTSAAEGPVQVVLGFAGALDRLLLAVPASASRGELVQAVERRERTVVRRAGEALAQVVEIGVPRSPGDLGPEAAARLERLEELRRDLAEEFPQARLVVDLAEFARHGRDERLAADCGERNYYDGLLFRGYVGKAALPVGSGGRYDQLFRLLGAEVPAVGFSFGLDRLLEGDGRGRTRHRDAGRKGGQ